LPAIAIDYTPAYEQGGGIGRYVRELVHALTLHDRTTDYRLFVAGTSHTTRPPQLADNFSWCPTRLSPRWLARLWHRANIPYRVERFTGSIDLFHATDFVLPPTAKTTPTLLTVHDLSFIRVPETTAPSLRKYLNRVVPHSIKRATHILADSMATKDDIIQYYGTASEKITVLYSGVSSNFYPLPPERLRKLSAKVQAKYQIKNRDFILSIGTVQPRKNYARLINAVAQMRDKGFDIDIVIAGGKGWLEDEIYQTIQTTNMQKNVNFIGYVDDVDLPILYNMAECFAFPSLYEGFGLPVLEAMACGTPVITSNISSLPEVAGNAALMIDPYNIESIQHALQNILVDKNLREDLIQKGFKQIKQFTWENAANQLLMIYQELLAH